MYAAFLFQLPRWSPSADEQPDDTQDDTADETPASETEDTAPDTDAGEQPVDAQSDVPEDAPPSETEYATPDASADEQPADAQGDVPGDAPASKTNKDMAPDANDAEQPADTQKESVGDSGEFNDGTQDAPNKELKRDELDLLKSGNDAINQRLEAQADDYRDKGMSEDEIRDRLAADKWNFQKEFLDDAFPGQDVSPNVFNGFSENGAKDRIADIDQSDTLRNQLASNETNNALNDGSRKWDEDEWGPDPFKPTTKDIVGEDEYKKYQDIYDNVDGLAVSDAYKDTLRDQIKNMDPELKGLYNDYANDLKCLDTKYPGTAHFSPSDGGFRFSETKDINKGLGTGNTFFHESGHMLDNLAGENGRNLSECNNLTNAIQEDYNDALANIMKAENCSYEDAQSKLSNELWKNPTASNCVSDVFGGISGNKVSGPWGHSADYWAKRDRSIIGKEAFAEMTADSASNAQSLAFTKKYMPKAYSTYQNMIKGARKNG